MYYLIYSYISFALIQWTLGDKHPRVFGGEKFRPHVHKHLVHLVLHEYNNGLLPTRLYECSGSILSRRWIISAAHCFNNNIKEVIVQKLGYDKVAEIANSCEYTVFPNFILGPTDDIGSEMIEKDLALLKTTKNILFDVNTQPIRLAETRPKVGQRVIVAGYGNSEYGRSIPREGSALLTKCSETDTKMLCTYSTMRTGKGDSGGPLVSKGRLVGVTSAGNCHDDHKLDQDCESYYVDVFHHLNWIRNVTGLK